MERGTWNALLLGGGAALVLAGAAGIAVAMGVFGSEPAKRARRAEEATTTEARSTAETTASAPPPRRASAAPVDHASATVVEELEVPVSASASAAAPRDVLAVDPAAPESPKLEVDFSRFSESAPLLTAPLPGVVDWLDTAAFKVPNPGWRVFKRDANAMFLASHDKHGDMVIAVFEAPSDIDKILATSRRIHGWRWRAPEPRTIGPDALPALVGTGSARGAGEKAVALFYIVVKGDPQSLLVLCVADAADAASTLTTGLGVAANVKRR